MALSLCESHIVAVQGMDKPCNYGYEFNVVAPLAGAQSSQFNSMLILGNGTHVSYSIHIKYWQELMMNKAAVLNLLKDNQNPRGIENWQELYPDSPYQSFGIGLTVLRKLAKQVGKSHELAQELWNCENYDAKVIAVLIDDPKHITEAQMETQVEIEVCVL